MFVWERGHVSEAVVKALAIPAPVDQALREGAALSVSISGGKDSQAMLTALVREYRRREWPGDIYAIHADLGRAEWRETPVEVERQCRSLGVRLVVVRRTKGDLISRWRDRMEKTAGTDRPFWSSAANRYCTSDLKRAPINKHLRGHEHVVCAMGLRAQESTARAKKDQCGVRSKITTKRLKRVTPNEALDRWGQGGRLALDWLPILDWTEAEVWGALGSSLDDLERRRTLHRLGAEREALEGWDSHPAYVWGNDRLSCAICILGSRGDLVNGARHRPETWRLMYEMEEESGWTFRQDVSLAEIGVAAGLLDDDALPEPEQTSLGLLDGPETSP